MRIMSFVLILTLFVPAVAKANRFATMSCDEILAFDASTFKSQANSCANSSVNLDQCASVANAKKTKKCLEDITSHIRLCNPIFEETEILVTRKIKCEIDRLGTKEASVEKLELAKRANALAKLRQINERFKGKITQAVSEYSDFVSHFMNQTKPSEKLTATKLQNIIGRANNINYKDAEAFETYSLLISELSDLYRSELITHLNFDSQVSESIQFIELSLGLYRSSLATISDIPEDFKDLFLSTQFKALEENLRPLLSYHAKRFSYFDMKISKQIEKANLLKEKALSYKIRANVDDRIGEYLKINVSNQFASMINENIQEYFSKKYPSIGDLGIDEMSPRVKAMEDFLSTVNVCLDEFKLRKEYMVKGCKMAEDFIHKAQKRINSSYLEYMLDTLSLAKDYSSDDAYRKAIEELISQSDSQSLSQFAAQFDKLVEMLK